MKVRTLVRRLVQLSAGLTLLPGGVAHAVQNATFDSTNRFPEVVRIRKTNGDGHCSGVLITPFWVITARHCFIGSSLDVDDDFFVQIGSPDPVSEATPFEIRHSVNISGNVQVRSESENNIFLESEISRDIAVFRLDQRVPRTVTKPLHPTMNPWGCQSSVLHMVGYGGTSFDEWVCDDIPSRRRYNMIGDWERDGTAFGDVFSTYWRYYQPFQLPEICNTYTGSMGGDSGGGLIHVDPISQHKTLCAIVSAHARILTARSAGSVLEVPQHLLTGGQSRFTRQDRTRGARTAADARESRPPER